MFEGIRPHCRRDFSRLRHLHHHLCHCSFGQHRRLPRSSWRTCRFKNGVSHLTANSDLQAAGQSWSGSRTFLRSRAPLSQSATSTMFLPKPRTIPAGALKARLTKPVRSGWPVSSTRAQTVVVGRARLGGIPMGVIAVKSRTIERVIPADPANPLLFEQRIMQAGQVWYPNSAYKTAQAIFDFNQPRRTPPHHLCQLAWFLRRPTRHV